MDSLAVKDDTEIILRAHFADQDEASNFLNVLRDGYTKKGRFWTPKP